MPPWAAITPAIPLGKSAQDVQQAARQSRHLHGAPSLRAQRQPCFRARCTHSAAKTLQPAPRFLHHWKQAGCRGHPCHHSSSSEAAGEPHLSTTSCWKGCGSTSARAGPRWCHSSRQINHGCLSGYKGAWLLASASQSRSGGGGCFSRLLGLEMEPRLLRRSGRAPGASWDCP